MRVLRLIAAAAAVALVAVVAAAEPASVEGFDPSRQPVSPAGTRAVCDVPAELHIRNTGGMGRGGPGTGAGLCVFTSVELASRWQNLGELAGFQRWMTSRPGGGWPEKLDKMLAEFCASKGVPVPRYVQHTGGDDEVLDLAIRTGRMPAVTYAGSDDFYRGGIDHMVDLAHLDATSAAIIDNNRPGVWVWMTRAEFLHRWRARGGGWACVLLGPPPPPPTTAAPMYAGPPVGGGCWGASTPAVAGPAPLLIAAPPVPAAPSIGTHPTDRPDVYRLTFNGATVGEFDRKNATFTDANGHAYSTAVPCAGCGCGCPCGRPAAEAAGDPAENFGLDRSKIHQARRYQLDGRECERAEALSAIGAGELSDDSGRFHLTLVGDSLPAGDVLAGDLAQYRDKVHLQRYKPTDWPVSARGLKPGATLQAPRKAGGKVLWQSAEYTPAALAEGLKFTDPNHKPTPPDPPPAPPPSPANPLFRLDGNTLLILVLAAVFFFRSQPKVTK